MFCVDGKLLLVLECESSFIGILIDDFVIKDLCEFYCMFIRLVFIDDIGVN